MAKKEKSPLPDGISRHRGWGPNHLQISKERTIFRQGDPADAVFYIQKGKVKITVISELGRKPLLRSSDRTNFAVRDA